MDINGRMLVDGRQWMKGAGRTEPDGWMLIDVERKLTDVGWNCNEQQRMADNGPRMTMQRPRCYITIHIRERCSDGESRHDDHGIAERSAFVNFAIMANGHDIIERSASTSSTTMADGDVMAIMLQNNSCP